MACFCSSFFQFYVHTFHPELVPGVQQGHLLRLVNSDPDYLQTVKMHLRRLEGQAQVVYINRREFDENGNHIYEALVVLGQPEQ